MRLPRMTTRRLMAIVAVVAVALAGHRAYYYWRLSESYKDMANRLDEGVAFYLESAAYEERRANGLEIVNSTHEPESPLIAQDAKEYRERASERWKTAAKFAGMSRKYRRAARRPWLPLPPEPK